LRRLLSSTTRSTQLASSCARARVRQARLNASSLPIPALTDAMRSPDTWRHSFVTVTLLPRSVYRQIRCPATIYAASMDKSDRAPFANGTMAARLDSRRSGRTERRGWARTLGPQETEAIVHAHRPEVSP
jgi:hypothetical protein